MIESSDSLMSIIPFILLFLLIMILLYVKYLNDRREYESIESFTNSDIDDIYLYPTQDLGVECAKDGLIAPAFGPTICQIGNDIIPYANCKCLDGSGKCVKCYEPIKRDITNANIVYDAYPSANNLNDAYKNVNSALTQVIYNS